MKWSLTLPARALLAATPVLGACGGPLPPAPGDCELLAGDLVITEIMANPTGADGGKEWFEIYNARADAVRLTGVTIEKSRGDLSGAKTTLLTFAGEVAAGDYLVVGAVEDDGAKPEYIDWGYGEGLTALGNSSGRLGLGCGGTVIDDVSWVDAPDGASLALSADKLDSGANDDPASWCTSTEERGDFRGSPGGANAVCGEEDDAATCLDGAAPRRVNAPRPGALVLSEILANPAAVDDAEGEYLELYVKSDVDLNGIAFAKGDAAAEPAFVIEAAECVSVAGDTYFLLAPADAASGGLEPDYPLGMTLGNAAGTIVVSLGGTLLDRVEHAPGVAGVARSVDPRYLDPDANDGADHWCDATTPFGDGDLGTPGAANGACASTMTSAASCDEGGALRAPVAPSGGDLVISELMQNPAAVADSVGEWLEICAANDVDLNGVELGREGVVAHTLASAGCLHVAAGACFVVGKSADAASNGGVAVDYAWAGLGLSNSGGALTLGYAGAELDTVTWSSSVAGASASYFSGDPGVDGNDDPAAWCPGALPWDGSAGDRGTPGAPNPACAEALGAGACSEGGAPRPIVKPAPGDLVITEVMPNPIGTDTEGEWLELLAAAAFDLNGVELGSDATDARPLAAEDCLSVAPGDYVVVVRSDTAAIGGRYVWPQMALSNAAPDALYVGVDGIELDSVAWSTSAEGVSLCRLSSESWGASPDGGTPGGPNSSCAP